MRHIAVLIAVGILVLAQASPVAADGLLNAVSYKPIPQGTPIFVRALDNSDHNLVLQERFERELRAKGYAVSEDASLVLSFETRDVVGAWTDRGLRTVIELKDNQHRTGQDPPQVNVNIFNANRGGLLNKGRGTGTAIVTPSHHRLDATIDDSSNGERIWQAWATADIGQSNNRALSTAMVPAVVEIIGSTVKNQPLPVP